MPAQWVTLPPYHHDTVASLQATPKPASSSLLRTSKNLGLTAENAFGGLRLVHGAVLHRVTSVGYPVDTALVSMVTLSVHL